MNYKYPHFGRIDQLYPNPHIMLGNDIYWTLKHDGSNTGFYHDEDEIKIRSRNMDEASFKDKVLALSVSDKIMEMMNHNKENYRSDFVVFGELLSKGKSPTGLKTFEEDDFIVFDIYDHSKESFVNFNQLCLLCGPFSIPVTKLIGKCNVTTMDELNSFRDEMLSLTVGEEGVVGKIYNKPKDFLNYDFLFVKEKHFIQKPLKQKRSENRTCEQPQLDEGEVRKCIAKVFDESSLVDFKDTKLTMPKIAKEVGIECKQQNCVNRFNLFQYYSEKLQEI